MTSLPNLASLRLKSLSIRKKKDDYDVNPLESLLRPIPSLDDDHDSDVSEISDVFEEFHKSSYLRPQNKHYLTKHEADVKTMDEFTDDFKKTMANIRNDLNIGDDLLLENVGDIEKIFEDGKDPKVFPKVTLKKETSEMLNDGTETIPRPQELQMRKVSDTSSESIIWHMLAANRDNKKFEISHPGFNTFKQKQPHWLQRASVSWVDIDQATLKCENWLEQHCQKFGGKRK